MNLWLLYAIVLLRTGRPVEPFLRTASTHPMRYYVVEPSRRPPSARPLPVLICLAGADADFRGTANRFAAARGEMPLLIVVPCTVSSANSMRGQTGQRYLDLYGSDLVRSVAGEPLFPAVRARLAWDEAGLVAILRDLGWDTDGGRETYLTGFSGGGIAAWWMTLRHPWRFAGVVPVCPNHAFWSVGVRDAAAGDRSTPIRVFSGENDALRLSRIGWPLPAPAVTLSLWPLVGVLIGYRAWRRWRSVRRVLATELLAGALALALVAGRMSGNDYQTAAAVEMMRRLGHPVEWTHEPGMWHEPAPAKVVATIARWRAAGR